MRIIIVGGGLVGSTLADRLARDGNDVALVERDAERVRELGDQLDVLLVEGNGATAGALRRAGVDAADLVVAVTDSDEVNMAVGSLAPHLGHPRRILVRLRDPDHHEGFDRMTAHLEAECVRVNPVVAAVERMASLLEVPGAIDVAAFMDGELLLAGFQIDASSDFAGLGVSNVQLMFAGSATLVAAIQRDSEWIVPHGKDELRAGDLVYFATTRAQLGGVLSLVNPDQKREPRNTVMIAGATAIGVALARRFESARTRVILIEEEADRAGRAADGLGQVIVVRGRATDRSLLTEEQIESVAAFVAVTDDQEDNLVAALLAKRLGAGRAIALVDNPDLVPLVPETAVDSLISPRQLAIDLALRHIRGIKVRSVADLLGGRIEVLEAEVGEGSRLTKASLADLELPRGAIVAALRRGRRLSVPRGADRIEPGDHVLLVTTTELAPKMSEFFDL